MDDSAFPNSGAIVSKNWAGDVVVAMFNKPELNLRANEFKPTMEIPDLQKKLLESQGVDLTLKLKGFANGSYKRVHYRFDETHGHAYHKWKEMGSPEDPGTIQYKELAKAMEPAVIDVKDIEVSDNTQQLEVRFPSCGLDFVIFATRSEAPARVHGLSYKIYSGLNGEDMLMLNWDKAASRGVLSYEVFAKKQNERSFKKVNGTHLLASGFAHATESAPGTRYKVRMVDYWDRKGKFSEVILVE